MTAIRIKFNSYRLSESAAEDMRQQGANDWDWDHQSCSRCGSSIHWSEANDDGTCIVCHGHEIEGGEGGEDEDE